MVIQLTLQMQKV